MPLMQLMRVSLDVQTSLALFRRLFEYLDLVPAIQDRPGAHVLDVPAMRGEVELRDVWFRYPEPRQLSGDGAQRAQYGGPGRPGGGRAERVVADLAAVSTTDDGLEAVGDDDHLALAGVTLRIAPGTLAAVVGPSGSGKTTLTYLVPRLHEVTRGACLIDGVDVRDLTLSSVADAVGMVTQEPYLFHGTIADNLRYARPAATDAEVEDAARGANIHDRIMSFDEGYDTITGERGYRLSGGEKQRLAIARVLLMDPKILILDEATSALDTGTERLVQEALERAMSGRTTIAIAHRLSTIMGADVIFGLEDGRLVEQGTHSELLAAGGLYAKLYTEQFGGGAVEARFDDAVQFTDGSQLVQNCDHVKADVSV
jgi:ATP-binding cassette subfamily B protein